MCGKRMEKDLMFLMHAVFQNIFNLKMETSYELRNLDYCVFFCLNIYFHHIHEYVSVCMCVFVRARACIYVFMSIKTRDIVFFGSEFTET